MDVAVVMIVFVRSRSSCIPTTPFLLLLSPHPKHAGERHAYVERIITVMYQALPVWLERMIVNMN